MTPRTAACQASLSFIVFWSLLKLMSIEFVMPSNHLIFCHPLLLLTSIFFSIMISSSELGLHIRWLEVLELQLQSLWLITLWLSPYGYYSLWLIIFMPDRGYGYHSQGFILTQVQSQSLWFLSPKCSHNLSLSDYPQILHHWSGTLTFW